MKAGGWIALAALATLATLSARRPRSEAVWLEIDTEDDPDEFCAEEGPAGAWWFKTWRKGSARR